MSSISKLPIREALQHAIGTSALPLPSGVLYSGLYADPPYRFTTYSKVTGMDRAPENHYSTMSLDDIMALPVGEIAAKNSLIALWATVPMLPEGKEVLKAWGFRYVSHIVWDKMRIGLGYWVRNQHELLLLGVKGRPPAPGRGTQSASVVRAPRSRHSEKPEIFATMLERIYFPATKPKIELFARRRRPGWDAWGAEAPPDDEA